MKLNLTMKGLGPLYEMAPQIFSFRRILEVEQIAWGRSPFLRE